MPTLKGARVLVTGGAGFIGSHLVDLLRAERDADVVVLDNLEPQTHPAGPPQWLRKEVRFHRGDVRNVDDVVKALRGVQYIFHLAAYGGFVPHISKYMDVNATGTLRLYEAIRDHARDVKKIVVASSQGIYGEGLYRDGKGGIHTVGTRSLENLDRGQWEHPDPVTSEPLHPIASPETQPHNSLHIYSISKYAEERVALALGEQLGFPTCCLRFAVTYGPRQSPHNPYTGVVAIFSTQILNDLPPLPYEDGLQTRDFIYVGDVVRGTLRAMEHEETAGQVYNIATGIPTTIDHLARTLASVYGRGQLQPVYRGYFRPSDVRHLVLDPGKLAKLGFQAKTPLADGLKNVAQWLQSTFREVPERFRAAEEELLRLGVVRKAHASQ